MVRTKVFCDLHILFREQWGKVFLQHNVVSCNVFEVRRTAFIVLQYQRTTLCSDTFSYTTKYGVANGRSQPVSGSSKRLYFARGFPP